MDVKRLFHRLKKLFVTIFKTPLYIVEHESKIHYLVTENMRMNQVIRELIYQNDLLLSSVINQTKDSFDYQWKEVGEGEFMPSNKDFLKTTPDLISTWTKLPKEWFFGKNILDAGCGSGRWSYGFVSLGAKVTALDQSAGAVEATQTLLKGMGDHVVARQDLLDMDIEKESFDFVWSYGVAHHTGNSIKALMNLVQAVKPGGYLFIMLYGFPKNRVEFETIAEYEEWRQRLLPSSSEEKVNILQKHYPEEAVHGYFDAISPQINELFTFEWIQAFLQNEGFEAISRGLDHNHHHVIAHKKVNEVKSVI